MHSAWMHSRSSPPKTNTFPNSESFFWSLEVPTSSLLLLPTWHQLTFPTNLATLLSLADNFKSCFSNFGFDVVVALQKKYPQKNFRSLTHVALIYRQIASEFSSLPQQRAPQKGWWSLMLLLLLLLYTFYPLIWSIAYLPVVVSGRRRRREERGGGGGRM